MDRHKKHCSHALFFSTLVRDLDLSFAEARWKLQKEHELQHERTHPDLHDLLASWESLDSEMCGVVNFLSVLNSVTDPNFLLTCLLLSLEHLNRSFPVELDLTLNKELD